MLTALSVQTSSLPDQSDAAGRVNRIHQAGRNNCTEAQLLHFLLANLQTQVGRRRVAFARIACGAPLCQPVSRMDCRPAG